MDSSPSAASAYKSDGPYPGVVLFDNPKTHKGGFACFAGDSPFRIEDTNELSSAGIWLTNLDSKDFRQSGLRGCNRFREIDYLRTTVHHIALELGYAVFKDGWAQASGPECAKRLAALFGRVMDVTWRLGVHVFPPMQLRMGYRDLHYRQTHQDLEGSHQHAITDAAQRHTTSERRAPRQVAAKERTVVLVRHRWEHAREVLSQQVPYGAWRTTGRMSPAEVVSSPVPLLVEVEVQKTDELIGKICNYGGSARRITGGGQTNATPRRWMTQAEFAFLAPQADISVVSVLACDEYRTNPLYEGMPEYDVPQMISPAFLLAIESYWTSALRESNGQVENSAVTTWMSCYDRIACMKDALTLVGRNEEIDIIGYGYGRLNISIPDPGEHLGAWLAENLKDTLLIPPNCVAGRAKFPVHNRTASPIEVLQRIQISGQTARYDYLDTAAIEDWDEQYLEDCEEAAAAAE